MLLPRHFLSAALVALLAIAAFAAPAAAQPAPLPTWSVGQAVGYGTNLNLTALAAPFLLELRNNPGAYNITSIQKLDFTGSLDLWVHQEVTSKTDTYYVLETESAGGLKIHFAFNATFNNLPVPGTYTGNCMYGYFYGNVPTMTRSLEVDVDLTALTTTSGTARYTVSELAIQRMTNNETDQMSARAILRGTPRVDLNLTLCQETIAYEDRDLAILVDTKIQLRELYSPALDVFNFPINDGEDWWVFSNATVGATLAGTIDVRGLSDADEKAFFDALAAAFQSVPGLSVTGLDHFPIDLMKITVTYGGTNLLKDGVLLDTNVPVAEHLQARQESRTLADGQLHEVMLLSLYQDPAAGCPPTLFAVYSVDDGIIVGLELYQTCDPTGIPIFRLAPVPADTAQNNIDDTKKNYVVFAPPGGNAIANFFFAAPYWGLILIVIAVAVVAFLFLRRRRRPTMAPAPGVMAPPPTPPSPPSPP